MPSRLDAPVLTVDVALIHKVDTRNVENLYSMWTVFSRCAGSLEEGRRLENLSWRLWNRETFCCEPTSEANSTTPAISIASRSSEGKYDVPELSGSLDSIVDEEALEFENESANSSPLEIAHPRIQRQDSCNSRSRGRERHITPDDLEKMVITIKEKKDLAPLTMNTHTYLSPLAEKIQEFPQPEQKVVEVTSSPTITRTSPIPSSSVSRQSGQSTTSNVSSGSPEKGATATSVVKGFSLSPAHISSSMRSIPMASVPSSIPTADIAAADSTQAVAPKKKAAMFALGGSSGDDSLSFGASSNEEQASLPKPIMSNSPLRKPLPKKKTSFQEEVASRTIPEQPFEDESAIESDSEDEEAVESESAIDDEDEDEWEDSPEEEAVDPKTLFQRVDSRPQLTSRRSLITTMLHQNDRAAALANAASRSQPIIRRSRNSSPNGPSLPGSPEDDNGPLMMKTGLKPISEIAPRAGPGPQPIIKTTTNTTAHQQALSPRTTRRNMLATELTVSLRQNLLWERQQKSQTANAVMKRRHTSHDVANLKQYPEKVHMDKEDTALNASWNQYFSQGLGEYHSKGW